jgi:hypothetical protein
MGLRSCVAPDKTGRNIDFEQRFHMRDGGAGPGYLRFIASAPARRFHGAATRRPKYALASAVVRENLKLGAGPEEM